MSFFSRSRVTFMHPIPMLANMATNIIAAMPCCALKFACVSVVRLDAISR